MLYFGEKTEYSKFSKLSRLLLELLDALNEPVCLKGVLGMLDIDFLS
jgi:hypothetical protein